MLCFTSIPLFQGITLWDAEMLQKNINVRPQPNTDYKIIASDSSEDKVEALNVSASLEASFLCGLVSVKGSADFLKDKSRIGLYFVHLKLIRSLDCFVCYCCDLMWAIGCPALIPLMPVNASSEKRCCCRREGNLVN